MAGHTRYALRKPAVRNAFAFQEVMGLDIRVLDLAPLLDQQHST
jgi:hypothetical protein